MAHALTLLFDAQTDAAVRATWASLEARGLRSMATATHGRHRPHVSLLVAPRITPAQARSGAEPLGAITDLSVRLGSVAVFPGRAGVLYFSVVPTLPLLRLHHALHARMARAGVESDRHYLPDMWVPHCTLAQGLTHDEVTTGVRAVKRLRSLDAEVTSVGLLDTDTGDIATVMELSSSMHAE